MYGTTLFVLCVIAAFAFPNAEARAASSDVLADGNCEEGKAYKVDCNTCVCGKNGVLACTLALCLNKRSAADNLGETCKPGEIQTIGDGCNYCTCTKQGRWACIDGNVSKCTDNAKTKRVSECSEGQSKYIDCNSCHCTKNGNWACTRKACLSAEDVASLHGNDHAPSGGQGGIFRV